jgi:transglutaminase-like putative cysteine protease
MRVLMSYVCSLQQSPEEEWWNVLMWDARIGYMHSRTEEGKYEGEEVLKEHIESVMEVERAGTPVRIVDTQMYYLTPDSALRYFLIISDETGEGKTVDGKIQDNVLTVETTLADVTTVEKYILPENVVFDIALYDTFVKRGLIVGDGYAIQIFSIDFFKMVDVSVEVLREEVVKYQGEDKHVFVVSYTMEGMAITVWLAPDGHTYREDLEDLLTLVRTSRADALSPIEAPDMFAEIKVPVIGRPPPMGVAKFTAKVALTNGDVQSTFPQSERQKVIAIPGASEGFLQIHKIDIRVGDSLRLPIDDIKFSDYLKPTVYIQSDDPQIMQQARDIVGNEDNAWIASSKICTWVFENIEEKNYSVGFASAKQTLESLEGDCSEHSVLFVALARSLGIPTKLCYGIAPFGDGFLYHVWAEVYVGEWVAVDPAFNQHQADAAHILLSAGTGDNMVEMGLPVSRAMNKLTIEIWDDKDMAVRPEGKLITTFGKVKQFTE